MKMTKLFSGLFAIMLLLVPLVSAIDLAPVVTLNTQYDRTTMSAVLTASAVDVYDNAGLAWIRIYENNVSIGEKACDDRVCTFVKVVVKTSPGGIFTYRADAFDNGGHLVSSEDMDISFAGVDEVDPTFANILPVSGTSEPFGTHTFSVDWTDNGRIGKVFIEHDLQGNVNTVEITQNRVGDTYSFTIDDINSFVELGDYTWRMTAEDVADQGVNTAETPWQDFSIVRADVPVNWIITPASTVDIGTATSVECEVADLRNTETVVYLQRDGVNVSMPNVDTLAAGDFVYTCVAEQTEHYNAVEDEQTITVNKIAGVVNLLLDTVDGNITDVERLSQSVTMDGNVVTGDGNLTLYVNGTEVDNGTVIAYSQTFDEVGTYDVRLVMAETDNYNTAEETHSVTVVDTVAPGMVQDLIAIHHEPDFMEAAWEVPTDEDFEGVMIYLDGAFVANVTGVNGTNSTWNVYSLTNLTPSTLYNITVYSYDRYGNVETTGYTINPTTMADTNAPEWSVTEEVGSWTYGEDVTNSITITKISVGAAKLASEIANISALNIISVGNPCNNAVTAEIMGNPANCSAVIPAGEAIIKVYDAGNGMYHVVVAGADDLSTRRASRVLANYADYALNTDEVKVTGTSLTDITVTVTGTEQTVDLGDYPIFLIENETLNSVVVIGDTAPAADVVSAIDIMTGLQFVASTGNKNPSVEWTDDVALSTVWFENDFTGVMTSDIVPTYNVGDVYVLNMTELSAGSYSWRGHANDTAGNVNTTDWFNFTVYQKEATCTVSVSATSIPYNQNVTVTGSCDNPEATAVLTRNGTDVTATELNASFPLPAGTWTYVLNVTATQNYTAATSQAVVEVTKLLSGVEILLNGAHDNITVFENEQFTLNGTLVTGESDISLYVDSVIVGIPQASPINLVRSETTAGVYNYTIVYDETANYEASKDELIVTVVPIIRNVSLSSTLVGFTSFDQNKTYTITVENTGNIVDNFTLSLTNTDSMDVAVLNQTVITQLQPGASVDIELEVGDNDTGSYNVTVDIVSDNDASSTDSIVIETRVVDYSEVINSWVNSVYYASGNYTTNVIPELVAARLVDSTVSDSLSLIEVSEVQRSTITNSTISDNSAINDSTITDSTLTRCTVLNSTVIATTSSDCYIEDSYVDPSDVTGSTITGDSKIWDSNVTNSNVDNLSVSNSNVDNSTVTDSQFSDVTVLDSTIDNSGIQHSTVTDSTVTNTSVWHSTIDNSVVTDSDLSYATVTDSTVTNSDLNEGAVVEDGSTVTDSTVDNATISNSTIINSTIPEGTDVDDAWVEDGVIVNGTVDGTDYTGSPTNLTDVVNYVPSISNIAISPNPSIRGQAVSFNAVVTDLNIGSALNDSLTYLWDFGDGTNATTLAASHTYASAGTYMAGLVVSDSLGAVETAAPLSVTVNNPSNPGGSSPSRRRSTSDARVITLITPRGSITTLDIHQGDMILFNLDEQQHKLFVKDITIDHVDFVVEPNPLNVTVDKYKTENVNLDGDQFNDISIEINGIIGNTEAKMTLEINNLVEYEPIVIPEPQPGLVVNDTVEPVVNDTVEVEDNVTAEPEAEELSIWQKIGNWFKNLFKSNDEEISPDAEVAFEGADEQPELDNEVTGAAVVDAEPSRPKAILGWALVFLVASLGISGYFVVRRRMLEQKVERYLM